MNIELFSDANDSEIPFLKIRWILSYLEFHPSSVSFSPWPSSTFSNALTSRNDPNIYRLLWPPSPTSILAVGDLDSLFYRWNTRCLDTLCARVLAQYFFFAYRAPLPPTRMFACLFYVSGVCIKLRLCKLLEREGEGEGERERGRIRLRQTGR